VSCITTENCKSNRSHGLRSLYLLQRIFLILLSSERTSAMTIRSLGSSTEHRTPICKIDIKQPSILSLLLLRPFLLDSASCWVSILSRGSMISDTWSGRAVLAKLWRLLLPVNMLSVGLFPVNISRRRMP